MCLCVSRGGGGGVCVYVVVYACVSVCGYTGMYVCVCVWCTCVPVCVCMHAFIKKITRKTNIKRKLTKYKKTSDAYNAQINIRLIDKFDLNNDTAYSPQI